MIRRWFPLAPLVLVAGCAAPLELAGVGVRSDPGGPDVLTIELASATGDTATFELDPATPGWQITNRGGSLEVFWAGPREAPGGPTGPVHTWRVDASALHGRELRATLRPDGSHEVR